VGDTRRRRTNGWAIAALTALAILAVVAMTAGLIVLNLPKKATVPNIVGMSLTDANNALQSAQLAPKPEMVQKLDCTKDEVLTQKTPPGTQLDEGSPVGFTYCGGPATTVVPNVVNLPKDNAESQLVAAGLRAEFVDVDSEAQKGQVVKTVPVANTRVRQGDTVKVQVSLGNMKKVADVSGNTESEARAVLTHDDFTVKVSTTITRDPAMVDKVVSQDPGAGQVRKVGTTITIFIGKVASPPTTAGEPTGEPSPEPT
jgi:serine/threonine-protein kinase